MGSWGAGNFDNDAAMDWATELDGIDAINGALRAAANAEDDELDADDACVALAAAEVVAAMRGRPMDELPDAISSFVESAEREVSPELLALANSAVQSVFESSELRELWEEDDDTFAEWEEIIGDLLDRLEPDGGRRLL